MMAFDTADLDAHNGIFALPREEWEETPEFDKLVKDRMAHQEEREQAFLSHKGDCFAIYQVKHTDELRDIRYEGLEWLQPIGQTVQRDNYELVYTAPLLPSDLKGDTAEQLFYRFNNEHPADYRHPSMSVSDTVAIKRDGKVSCHYCDSFGFEQVPGFLPDNPLKNAEMVVEDDYGMIDGIINNGPKEPTVAQLEQQARSGQPISLMDLAAAAHREDREKKKSVMEQLKSQPRTETKRQRPKRARKGRFDMGNFTFEETNLLCIYNTGSRTGLIDALTKMRGELSPEETELRELTDSALGKLQAMSDAEFAKLERFPDFDE